MQSQLDAYLAHLRNERQLSAHTLDAYQRDMQRILALCMQDNLTSWNELDTARLRRMIARLHQQGQSGRSLARLLSAVRGFYHYLLREGLCRHDHRRAHPRQ